MIIRVFRARVKPEKRKKLEGLIRENIGPPLVRRQKGLIAYYPGKPMASNPHEFVMITIWKDLTSLKRFVGRNWKEALIPAEEERRAVKKYFVHHYAEL